MVLRYTPNGGGKQYISNMTTVEPPRVFRYIQTQGTGSIIPVLSPYQSMVTYTTKKQKSQPNNIVGFFFSVTNAINDSMIRSIGNFNLQNLIGDPRDTNSNVYPDLLALDNIYWTNYSYNFKLNTFVDFVENLLHALFVQARDLVPVRAKLLGGIVHEPHVLERSKISLNPPFSENDTLNTSIIAAQTQLISGSMPAYFVV
jgi:hypothetical protein